MCGKIDLLTKSSLEADCNEVPFQFQFYNFHKKNVKT